MYLSFVCKSKVAPNLVKDNGKLARNLVKTYRKVAPNLVKGDNYSRPLLNIFLRYFCFFKIITSEAFPSNNGFGFTAHFSDLHQTEVILPVEK